MLSSYHRTRILQLLQSTHQIEWKSQPHTYPKGSVHRCHPTEGLGQKIKGMSANVVYIIPLGKQTFLIYDEWTLVCSQQNSGPFACSEVTEGELY